ncbi:MAG: hypothetical protein ACK5DM_11590, partial [Planctomyces sp.]
GLGVNWAAIWSRFEGWCRGHPPWAAAMQVAKNAQAGARAGKPELRKCVLLGNTWTGRLRSVRSAGEYVSGSAQAAGKYSMAG